jgi:hypothetical protein
LKDLRPGHPKNKKTKNIKISKLRYSVLRIRIRTDLAFLGHQGPDPDPAAPVPVTKIEAVTMGNQECFYSILVQALKQY